MTRWTWLAAAALLPQDDGDICQWLEYGQELSATYLVALVDWAEPRTEVPALAVATLRDAEPRRSCSAVRRTAAPR